MECSKHGHIYFDLICCFEDSAVDRRRSVHHPQCACRAQSQDKLPIGDRVHKNLASLL